jgi:hypothetical protein
MTFIRYPDFPDLPFDLQQNPDVVEYHDNLRLWWGSLKDELEARDKATLYGAANAEPWQLVAVTAVVTHTFAPASATDTYTANRLATLIKELKDKGIVS